MLCEELGNLSFYLAPDEFNKEFSYDLPKIAIDAAMNKLNLMPTKGKKYITNLEKLCSQGFDILALVAFNGDISYKTWPVNKELFDRWIEDLAQAYPMNYSLNGSNYKFSDIIGRSIHNEIISQTYC